MPEIAGTPGNDTLNGTAGDDIVRGFAGDDRLNGGSGFDRLYGGADDDLYYILDDSGDQVIELAGEGADQVYVAFDHVLAAGQSVELLSTVSHGATTAIDLTGNNLANLLIGNAGINVLNGRAGADTMQGLGGNDIYHVDNAADLVLEAAGQGNDAVYASASYMLAAGQSVETLSTASHGATIAIDLTGNNLANILIGNAGANVLNGRAGADSMQGLGGNDIYHVDVAADLVFEGAGNGNDAVYAAASYALAAHQSVELLSTASHGATTAINLTGNNFANILIGNAGANVLDGRAGADSIQGLAGNDVYHVDAAADLVFEAAGQGNDAVYAGASYVLRAGQSVETLSTTSHGATTAIDLTGNNLANLLIGNAGANVLNGGAGADTMQGLAGNDVYHVDAAADLVVEAAGQGNDAVYASAGYALAASQSVETLSTVSHGATTAIDLAGNNLANTLVGNAGANILDGKGGSDVLIGLGGADTFAFTIALGAGNVDTVAGFQPGVDKIQLGGNAGQPFALLASEEVAGGAFVIGAAALQADDVLIYNASNGALLYDSDGNGAAAAIQFATLSSGLALAAADFVVSGPANRPPVIGSPTTASVVENSAATTIVYQTMATDADGDRITYALGGVDSNLLTIDNGGAVRLKAPADFEIRTTYSFSVIASDSGPDSAVRNVILQVTNINEATPILNETGSINDSIGAAQAVDRGLLAPSENPDLTDDGLPSATIQGNVVAPGDRDFFSIVLQAGERLILDVDGTEDLDSHVRVYGPGGVEIDNNDDLEIFDEGSAPGVASHNTDSFFAFRAPSAGTYYFSIEAFQDSQNPTSGVYRLHVSVAPPATAAEIVDEDVDALISGLKWATPNLTYSFPTSPGQYPPDIAETDPPSDFAPFTTAQQQAMTKLLQMAADVSSLTFQLAANPASAHLKFAMSDEADPAFAYYPPAGNPTPGSELSGTAWFNRQDFNNPQKGGYAWAAMLHEAGHTLGLKHGHETPVAVSPDHDSLEYTVMTYRSYPGAGVGGPNDGYSNEDWGYPQTLMMLDIAALQRIYGADFGHNSTDTIYWWNPGTGGLAINGSGQGDPNDGAGGTSNRLLMTIWDGGGIDTYDLSLYTGGSTIDLRPGEWTTTSAVQLANLGEGHVARGNIANALLYQGDLRSLIENAAGGSGGDTLVANQAANRFQGMGGADIFKWVASTDVGVGPLADTIADFVRGSDRIHLEAVDAVAGTPANDAFAFIGAGAFTSVAGQLRYQVEGANVRVQGDLDGNGIADLEIVVNNNTILAGTDFFL